MTWVKVRIDDRSINDVMVVVMMLKRRTTLKVYGRERESVSHRVDEWMDGWIIGGVSSSSSSSSSAAVSVTLGFSMFGDDDDDDGNDISCMYVHVWVLCGSCVGLCV